MAVELLGLLKEAATLPQLRGAYRRLGLVRHGTSIATTPTTRQAEQVVRQVSPSAGRESPEEVRRLARKYVMKGGRGGTILMPVGGTTRFARKGVVGRMAELRAAPTAERTLSELSPAGQQGVNIVGGLHEGFERGVRDVVPMHSHAHPEVILKEHNLVRSLTGAGAGETRGAMQALRGGAAGEDETIRSLLSRIYGPEVAARFQYGDPTSLRFTKAMRKDIARRLRPQPQLPAQVQAALKG